MEVIDPSKDKDKVRKALENSINKWKGLTTGGIVVVISVLPHVHCVIYSCLNSIQVVVQVMTALAALYSYESMQLGVTIRHGKPSMMQIGVAPTKSSVLLPLMSWHSLSLSVQTSSRS